MKRSPAWVVVTVLLGLLALRLFRGYSGRVPDTVRLPLNVGFVALAIFSLITAMALWRRDDRALRLFAVWALGYLGLGAVMEYFAGDASPARAGLWLALVGAVLLAVGAHLRHVERR